MPSTYSTNLKLQLMATGEDNGTWGDNTNNNLGTLIEESIIGAATVAMADANQTITTPDGLTGSGRKVYLTCTGALTANRNLVVPTANKNYVIENATTGGFSIVIKTTAGTGITVGAGLKRYVYADGTNVVEAINSVGNLTITGTLGTIGALTVTGNVAAGTFTTAGTFNKVAITAPATGSTLTIADGKTLTASNTLTLTGTDSTSFAFPSASDTVVTLTATQTLTNKTLTTAALGSSTATTQTQGDNSTKVATTEYVDTGISAIAGLPAGVTLPYAGATAPTGYLLCYGQAISRATYSALFAAISTAYGVGDGSTTFNLPDLRGRVPAGLDNMGGSNASRLTSTTMSPNGTTLGATGGTQTHTLTEAEMPSHSHLWYGYNIGLGGSGGGASVWMGGSGSVTSAAGSSAAHLNVQPTLMFNYIIKV